MDVEQADQEVAGPPQGWIETCVHCFASDLADKGVLQKPRLFMKELYAQAQEFAWPSYRRHRRKFGKVVKLLLHTHGVPQQISNNVCKLQKGNCFPWLSLSPKNLPVVQPEEPRNGILGNVVQSSQIDTLRSHRGICRIYFFFLFSTEQHLAHSSYSMSSY